MTELDALLELADERGYTKPTPQTRVLHHNDCADVLVLTDDEHAYAYRLPTGADIDVFTPTLVYWWYNANPVWTLRALLTLPTPDQPNAPHTLTPAPSGVWIWIAGNREQ